MITTNESQLIRIAIEGKIAPALVWPNTVGHDGTVHNVPGLGGITYNVLVGDTAFGWQADHVEPGVSSVLNPDKRSDRPNVAYNFLACVGNEAIVMSGNAKGAKGVVVGHHGGVEHVMLDFEPSVLEKLSLDDKFQIRAFGQGLVLEQTPEVFARSLDPRLLKLMKATAHAGRLTVPVTAIVPGALMGSGLGSGNTHSGDYDIMTSDTKALKRHKLDKLRLGDVVAITDHDASFGWRYLEGGMLIGIVIHGDSHVAGHGPGVCTILTSATGKILPKIDPTANIGKYLKLGRFRHGRK